VPVDDDQLGLAVTPAVGGAIEHPLLDPEADLRGKRRERSEHVRVAVAGDRLSLGLQRERLMAGQRLGL